MTYRALLIDHEGIIREIALPAITPTVQAVGKPRRWLSLDRLMDDPLTIPEFPIVQYRLDRLESEARGMLVYYREPL